MRARFPFNPDLADYCKIRARRDFRFRCEAKAVRRLLLKAGVGGRASDCVGGTSFGAWGLCRGMDAFILVSWSDDGPVLADPATVGYAWRLDELDQVEDVDEPDFDRNAYEQGFRWCTSFSCCAPEGESGWLPDENLLPLSQNELDQVRVDLARGPDPFWRSVDAMFAHAATRSI